MDCLAWINLTLQPAYAETLDERFSARVNPEGILLSDNFRTLPNTL